MPGVQWLWFCYHIKLFNWFIFAYGLVRLGSESCIYLLLYFGCILPWSKAISYFCVRFHFHNASGSKNVYWQTWNCYQFGWMFDCITSFDPWYIKSTLSQSFTHSCFGHAKLERKIRTIHLVHYRNIIWIARYFFLQLFCIFYFFFSVLSVSFRCKFFFFFEYTTKLFWMTLKWNLFYTS